jgi:hypothetical protein
VTAAADSGDMFGGPRRGLPGRTGVLILRVWLEGRNPTLRIRMTARRDLDLDDEETTVAGTAEEALAYIHAWLDRFGASGEDSGGD